MLVTPHRESFVRRPRLPSLEAFDEEIGHESEQISSSQTHEEHPRRLPSVWLLLTMVVVGVVSALMWRQLNPQLRPSPAEVVQSSPTQPTLSTSNAGWS